MKLAYLAIPLLMLGMILTSCTAGVGDGDDRAPLGFVVELAERGAELEIDFGLRKTGVLPDEILEARWQLTNDDGELRAEATSYAIESATLTDDGQVLHLITWHGELEPGWYTLLWGVDGYGGTTVEFEVLAHDGGLLLGEVSNP
ncbi:MAG: hypothetical protein JXA97_11600 [Anaerolineales bacterium]|nr:hypothetical protein [Anaerolineales bacterium]